MWKVVTPVEVYDQAVTKLRGDVLLWRPTMMWAAEPVPANQGNSKGIHSPKFGSLQHKVFPTIGFLWCRQEPKFGTILPKGKW
jgi:hypothetical protein